MAKPPKIVVTGASGQLGGLVIFHLLKDVPAADIGALVRRDNGSWTSSGVQVMLGDYMEPETLAAAFQGVEKVLLISSNALGQRVVQHGNVIAAAKQAGVKLLAYTSVLHADTSSLGLAQEHRDTESAIRASGLTYVLLRNGWYTENYTGSIAAALAHHAVIGSAGDGKISAAARNDYAEAAAKALVEERSSSHVYELAGDSAFTLSDFAAELSRQTSTKIVYQNLPEAAFEAALNQAGLPAPVAAMLADSSTKTGDGVLYDDTRQLSRLLDRPTIPLAETIASALRSA